MHSNALEQICMSQKNQIHPAWTLASPYKHMAHSQHSKFAAGASSTAICWALAFIFLALISL